MIRPSTIMLLIVIAAALWAACTAGLAMKRTLDQVGHRLDCALQVDKGADSDSRKCEPDKKAAQ